MRLVYLLFFFIPFIGYAQDSINAIVCYGALRHVEIADRIDVFPERIESTSLDLSTDDTLPRRKEQLIVSFPYSQVVYAEFDHLIQVGYQRKKSTKSRLECDGCDTLYRVTKDHDSPWVIRADSVGEIILKIVSKKGNVLSSRIIPVVQPPMPEIYLDGFNAQSTLTKLPEQIRVQLNKTVPKTQYYPIKRWDILINNEEWFAGHGSAIPQVVRDYMQSLGSGTIRIDISYFSATGTQRIREIFSFTLKK